MGEASLDMVIVSYQCRDLLRDCLASLRAHPPGVPTQVFVVESHAQVHRRVELARESWFLEG